MYTRNSNGHLVFSGPVSPEELFAAVDAIASERLYSREELKDPAHVKRYLTSKLQRLEHEEFHIIYLDCRHCVIGAHMMFRGGVTGAAVYIGTVVREALMRGAAAIIVAHNHPSGNPEPSYADRDLTERLRQALALVEIRLLDHVVIGGASLVSFAERGWI